jgi:YHS domain-containing protein
MLRFLGEFVSFIFFLLLMRSVISGVWQLVRGSISIQNPAYQPQRAGSRGEPVTGELRKDPVCGTFVATTTAWTRTIEGKPVYYCSKQCFEKVSAADPRAGQTSGWEKSTAGRR